MDFVDAVYRLTADWPQSELYALTNQLRRAAVSIPANIAEGRGRNGRREYVHHLHIARGSLFEAETHILIGQRQGYLGEASQSQVFALSNQTSRLLSGLIRSLTKEQPE